MTVDIDTGAIDAAIERCVMFDRKTRKYTCGPCGASSNRTTILRPQSEQHADDCIYIAAMAQHDAMKRRLAFMRSAYRAEVMT